MSTLLKHFYDSSAEKDLISDEWALLSVRREMLRQKRGQTKSKITQTSSSSKSVEANRLERDPSSPLFGIALSGGGIRSATFNLGFLRALNARGLLREADYLSTVSGGGYVGAFVQERLRQTGSYATLFARKELERLRDYGDYLRPGSGMTKAFESITFYLTFAGLTLLHLLWYLLFFAFVLITLIVIAETLPPVPDGIMQAVILSTAATVGWYYFAHTLRHVHRHLWSARVLFYLMTTLLTPSICPHMLPDAS
jgi:hypothetical protein